MLFPIRLLHILTRTFLKYLRVLKHTTTEIEAKKKNDCFFKGQVAGKLMKYYTVHYDLLFQKFSKFQKWYQKLPSYVCRNTQKFYQAEACTLGDIAIFVSRVGRGKSGNLTHFTTKMSTFFEFSREKSNLRGFAAAMTYIFIN